MTTETPAPVGAARTTRPNAPPQSWREDAPPSLYRPDAELLLWPLTFFDKGDEVTVGRPDIDVYCVLGADGAAVVRRLGEGNTPAQVSRWYADTYGEALDMAEFIAALAELDFLRNGEQPAPTLARPVRWQRLGRAVFSPVAFGAYTLLVVAAVVATLRQPALAPRYANVFFTPYLTVIELTLFLGQMPLLLLHESFHALAGRRIGLRSHLGIGRRLNFLVFETSMDGLVAVPRRKRILPMLAGMLVDLLVMAAFTLIASIAWRPGHPMPVAAGALLALAFGTLLRLLWQFSFYLRTDLYYVVTTFLGCVNLQETAKALLRNRAQRLLRRPERCSDEATWHPRDRAVARWYAWLMLVGYTTSIITFAVAALPPSVIVAVRLFHALTDPASAAAFLDAAVLLALNLGQGLLLAAIAIRDRRRRRSYVHVTL